MKKILIMGADGTGFDAWALKLLLKKQSKKVVTFTPEDIRTNKELYAVPPPPKPDNRPKNPPLSFIQQPTDKPKRKGK